MGCMWKKALPGLLILLLFIAIYSDVTLGGRTFLPIAPSYGVMPGVPFGYDGPISYGLTTIDPAGVFNVSYAFDALTAASLRAGHLPVWNPYQALGQPFLANGISSVLFPFSWLQALISPAWWDMVYVIPWLLAAFFTYAYLRLWKIDKGASLLGATTIFASGLCQFYVTLREYGGTWAWLPLLIYGIERSMREPGWRWRHAVLALGIFLTMSSGQPEIYFVSMVAVSAYAVVRLIAQKKNVLQATWLLLPGALAGILLSVPNILSFSLYALDAFSNHAADAQLGLTHLPRETIATYVFPFLFGHSNLGPYVETWFPLLGVFLGVMSVSLIRKKLPAGWWLAVLAVLTIGGKIWGAPLLNHVGGLPFFDRLVYPRYAAFILTSGLAVLTAFGAHYLARLPARQWRWRMLVWVLIVVGLLTLGIESVWPTIDFAHLMTSTNLFVGVYGVVAGIWALILPAGLWWLKARKPEDTRIFYGLALAGISLQAIAYGLNGYQMNVYAMLSLVCLGIFILMTVLASLRRFRASPKTGVAGLVAIALIPLITTWIAPQGQAKRYDPLTKAPYIEQLQTLQQGGVYRSYSFDGTPQPNFAAPFGISSLNNVEAVMNLESATFMFEYLDSQTSPIWFAGNLSHGRVPGTAITQYLRNKQYFDLVGVRYLVTYGSDLAETQYDTEGFLQTRTPTPLFTPLVAAFSAPSESISTIPVLLSTYGKINPGVVRLELIRDGVVLHEARVRGEELLNNSLQTFAFAAVPTTPGEQLTLRLTFVPTAPDSMIAAWVYLAAPELGFTFRIVDQPFALAYTDPATQVKIWDNPDALPRVFLAPSATVEPDWLTALNTMRTNTTLSRSVAVDTGTPLTSEWPVDEPTGSLNSFELQANSVDITYQAFTPGILTLTDTYAEGWHVEVNNQPAELLRVNGVFRGVRLDEPGRYTIRFWYRPPHWEFSLTLAGLGVLLLVAATILTKRPFLRHFPRSK